MSRGFPALRTLKAVEGAVRAQQHSRAVDEVWVEPETTSLLYTGSCWGARATRKVRTMVGKQGVLHQSGHGMAVCAAVCTGREVEQGQS